MDARLVVGRLVPPQFGEPHSQQATGCHSRQASWPLLGTAGLPRHGRAPGWWLPAQSNNVNAMSPTPHPWPPPPPTHTPLQIQDLLEHNAYHEWWYHASLHLGSTVALPATHPLSALHLPERLSNIAHQYCSCTQLYLQQWVWPQDDDAVVIMLWCPCCVLACFG
jgi:hypothetical protein